jgi:hypothetical protein
MYIFNSFTKVTTYSPILSQLEFGLHAIVCTSNWTETNKTLDRPEYRQSSWVFFTSSKRKSCTRILNTTTTTSILLNSRAGTNNSHSSSKADPALSVVGQT